MMDLVVSTPKEQGHYLVSKWLRFQLLLTVETFKELLDFLSVEVLFGVAGPDVKEELVYSKETYLAVYKAYLEALQRRDEKLIKELMKKLCVAIAYEKQAFYQIELADNRCLIKIKEPSIQFRPFNFIYHKELQQFLMQVKSKEAINFGLEISFPQIFQDPKTAQILHVFKDQKLVSARGFKKVQSFVKSKTKPAKFLIEDQIKTATFRIEKMQCSFAQKLLKDKELKLFEGEK